MSFLLNPILTTLGFIWNAVIALLSLIALVFSGLFSLGKSLALPLNMRRGLRVLRCFFPVLRLPINALKAYPAKGLVLVTRTFDVKDVLTREDDFDVIYAPRMKDLTGGSNFFLGMEDTAQYTADVAHMRLCVRREDLDLAVAQIRDAVTVRLETCEGQLDVVTDLFTPVLATWGRDYYGLLAVTPESLSAWTQAMFWYQFFDQNGDETIKARALDAAEQTRKAIDLEVQSRRQSGLDRDDVLGRVLKLQAARPSALTDQNLRDNLLGLMIATFPTLAKTATQALDQLLDRNEALAFAQHAARQGQDDALLGALMEALRFNPMTPLVLRRAKRDCVIGAGSLHATPVKAGDMVLPSNLSVMFDEAFIPSPERFDPHRPPQDFMMWGWGRHLCFGSYMHLKLMPALLGPLLTEQGLERAKGRLGQLDMANSPFPAHLWVRFDPLQ